jgi:hypothetical protein
LQLLAESIDGIDTVIDDGMIDGQCCDLNKHEVNRMAKKQAKQSTGEKVRMELRFDSDVYEGIRRIADEAEISVNQLMQGIARWAASAAHVGECDLVESDGIQQWSTRVHPGCVWFGTGPDAEQPVFELDFTERHVVRERWDEKPTAEM